MLSWINAGQTTASVPRFMSYSSLCPKFPQERLLNSLQGISASRNKLSLMPAKMKSRSTLPVHATIITVDPERTIWLDAALYIAGIPIGAIDKSAVLLQNSLVPPVTKAVDCRSKTIILDLINTHAFSRPY